MIEGPPPQSTTLVVLIFEGDRGMDIPQAFQNYTMRHKCAKPKANNCLARLRFNTICGSGSRLRAIASAYKPPIDSSKDKKRSSILPIKIIGCSFKVYLIIKILKYYKNLNLFDFTPLIYIIYISHSL